MKVQVTPPEVSAIVPTYNSERTLERCLRSILNQTSRPIEVIVVDNFSSDASVRIAEEFGARLFSAKLGMSAARNLGISRSRGRYLLSLDSDFELSSGLVEECIQLCISGFDAVSINENFMGAGFWGTCRRLENRTYWDDPIVFSPRFYSRELFDEVGGYDAKLTAGEDYDFGMRLMQKGFRVAVARSLIFHHESDLLREIVMKKYRYGKSMRRFLKKHGSAGARKFYPIRREWILKRRVLVEKPAVFLGIPFLKFLQYYSALIGFLIGDSG